MTSRGKDADKSWFSLFHEIAHIVLGHLGKTSGTTEEEEHAADKWAANMLISEEAFKPNAKLNWRNGMTDWCCPLCGECVGIHSNGQVHEVGWLYKRDECKNGHKVDWDT